MYNKLLDYMVFLAGCLLIFLMLTISGDVVGRYFLGKPIGWAVEYAEHILLYIPFLGMPWLVRQKGHVSVDVFLNVFNSKIKYIITSITSFISAITCAFCAFWAMLTAWDNYKRSILTVGIYPIPKMYLIIIVAIGMTFTCIEFLRYFKINIICWKSEKNNNQQK